MSAIALSAVSAFAAVNTPTIGVFSDYKGDSFVAKWSGSENASFLLTVFSTGENTVKVSEDFSNVKQSNGKLDAENPGLPTGWTTNLSESGRTDVVFYNEKNHLLLDSNGEYVKTPMAEGGNIVNFVLNANVVDATGITKENSSVFYIKIYDKENDLLTSGRIEVLYFASRQEFDLAEAFGYNPVNIGKIEIGIEKGDGKSVGNLAINSISYEYAAPEYFFTDKAVTEQSYTVEGINPDKIYYYNVKEKSGEEVSDKSGIMKVDGFMPTASKEASDITSTSFIANWQYLPKAKGYYLQAYRYDTVEESGENVVLKETFSKSTAGSELLPETVTDPDAITDNPGWSGRNLIAAEGMLGANSGRFPMNISNVYSPEMNLSAKGGKYKVYVKAKGTAGDNLNVYHAGYVVDGKLNIHSITFDSKGVAEDTWEFNDGDAETVLSFEESKLKKFLLDEVTVTQSVEVGDEMTVNLPVIKIEDGKTTSYQYSDLKENGKYAYEVQGWRLDDFGYEQKSTVSEKINVTLKDPSGIDNNEMVDNRPVVNVAADGVAVTLCENAPIYVYSFDGGVKKVYEGKAGVHKVELVGGAYIVKVGGVAYKVVL